VPNSPVRRGDGRGDGDGGDDDGGDDSASYAWKTTKRLTGGAGLPARGSARSGWQVGLARQRERGRGVRSGCARAKRADNGPKGGKRGREG
jgi:hypothetical protein